MLLNWWTSKVNIIFAIFETIIIYILTVSCICSFCWDDDCNSYVNSFHYFFMLAIVVTAVILMMLAQFYFLAHLL